MSVEGDEEHSKPLGTSPGVFWQEGDTVAARLDLFRVMEFIFAGESEAAEALQHLHASLQSDDEISVELRDCYSLEGMLDFIARFIPRDDVVAVRWLTRLRITVDGLEFQLPDGQWFEAHVENVSNPYNWEKVGSGGTAAPVDWKGLKDRRDAMTPGALMAFTHFGLSSDFDWEGLGHVYRQDGLSLWFPED